MSEIQRFSRLRRGVRRVLARMALAVCLAQCGEGHDSGHESLPTTPTVRFSATPSDGDFLRAGLFVQPLVPSHPTTASENRDLATALNAYVSDSQRIGLDGVEALVTFLANHPDSAWKPVLLVDLGAIYRKTGHFSIALETWEAAWADSKSLTEGSGPAIGDAAIAYLSQFEAYLGRKELLEPLLAEVKSRPLRGAAESLMRLRSSVLSLKPTLLGATFE